MSTSVVQATPRPSWKEEVNRRLAEHHGRKAAPPSQTRPEPSEHSSASRRAQEAAARVAARYANTPSFSEVLAAEAMAALRSAKAASHAALEAQAAIQSVLAGIEAAVAIEPPMPQLVEPPANGPTPPSEPFVSAAQSGLAGPEKAREPVLSAEAVDPVSIRWDRELPTRSIEPAKLRETRGSDSLQEQCLKLASDEFQPAVADVDVIEEVEPALPIQGNVIEFPRELIATRKARPRLAENPSAEPETVVQLSIFEIDPAILPVESAADAEAMVTPAEAWAAPSWSGIKLDAQPLEEIDEPQTEPARNQQTADVEPATAGWRLLAIGMDAALILSAVLGAGIAALQKAPALPSLRAVEFMAAASIVLFAGIYQVLFFTMSRATPGMRYAHLRLWTLDGNPPTRAQRTARLFAMLLSVLPAGLGLAWAIFDENHLSWHDRFSGTYLRRG